MDRSKFDAIDFKLSVFASKFNTQVTDGTELFAKSNQMPNERRILWIDKEIWKMVTIHPYLFPKVKKDSSLWDFTIVAWLENAATPIKPMWQQILVFQSDFQLIVEHIDDILNVAEAKLNKITKQDLSFGISVLRPKPGLHLYDQ